MKNYGFTLIELLVVIGIISLLASMSVVGYGRIRGKANASKVATDFQQIKLGWELWKNSSNAIYPREGASTNPDITCFTEPSIEQTVVQSFLGDVYRDPWGVRYSYDNDGDTFSGAGAIDRGVNIALHWCAGNGSRYIDMATFIDQTIDGGDGASAGKVRWNTNAGANGGIYYLIAVNEAS
ncbi:MAG: prepilin-type N-terminal cleavage/methylation domain-containing protein [bacterium]|nr:prepilin-type N-terminal cleavage/methylation domain-containing protein [bacterium]